MQPRTDLYHGLFRWHPAGRGPAHVSAHEAAPRMVPDPQTGRMLKVASLEVTNSGVCPACAQLGTGGYVSFVSDLRLAFACPSCRTLVWMAGS